MIFAKLSLDFPQLLLNLTVKAGGLFALLLGIATVLGLRLPKRLALILAILAGGVLALHCFNPDYPFAQTDCWAFWRAGSVVLGGGDPYAGPGDPQSLPILNLPNALPFFFTALKVVAPLAVVTAFVAEYFGGLQNGLGKAYAPAATHERPIQHGNIRGRGCYH